jgi:tetratricopeptide (TPR) repeat protein
MSNIINQLLHRIHAVTEQLQSLENEVNTLISSDNFGEASQLLLRARQASDREEILGLLRQLLAHPEADSRTVEIAGDFARNSLDNIPLATRLYARAVDIDPANVSALSEYLGVQAYDPARRDEAKAKIVELALKYPNRSVIINNTINFFIRVDDYAGLKVFCEDFLGGSNERKSKERSLLYRNLAVALTELGHDINEIRDAYEQAFELGDSADYVNAARPYIRLLLSRNEPDQAAPIIDRAVQYSPGDAALHRLRGEVYRELQQYDIAQLSFEIMGQLGTPSEKYESQTLIRNLTILRTLFGRTSGSAAPNPAPAAPPTPPSTGFNWTPPSGS